jgi:hypothetical protein
MQTSQIQPSNAHPSRLHPRSPDRKRHHRSRRNRFWENSCIRPPDPSSLDVYAVSIIRLHPCSDSRVSVQITTQFEALGAGIGVKVATITGGVDHMSQAIALSKKPHVVVASPGRLLDHLETTKRFSLRTMKYLVFGQLSRE